MNVWRCFQIFLNNEIEKYNVCMKVERYVSDEAGVPDRDKVFIRE